MLLAGDIGGTNTRLAFVEPRGLKVVQQARLKSRSFGSFERALQAFLGQHPQLRRKLKRACFGIAGPVFGGRCEVTNLPWTVDERRLRTFLGIEPVRLVNDLVAVGWGAAHAGPSKLLSLNGLPLPRPTGANLAILSAGTGLGQAALVWSGRELVPLGTEGSHSDFAPRNALEWRLLHALQRRFGRVSAERALCGPGLSALYEFFRDDEGLGETAANSRARAAADDANAFVLGAGLQRRSRPAHAAVELFVSLYGAEAGNVALRYLATGGIFLGGNISGLLQAKLRTRLFHDAFCAKGRYRKLLRKIPVALVTDPDIGLWGAARLARGD